MESREQCLYCSSHLVCITAHVCSKCYLYQLPSCTTEETPLFVRKQQHTPKEGWIELGRKRSGHLVLCFPEQFTNIYRNQIGEEIDVFHDEGFKKAQIWNWVRQNIGMNPSAHFISSFLEKSRKKGLFNLYNSCSSSLFRMVVDVIGEISINNDETFQLPVHLKLYLIPRKCIIDYRLQQEEHRLLVYFLIEPDILDKLTDPKMNCSEQDLMVSSSAGCGYYIQNSHSIIDFYESLLREGNRLGFNFRGWGFNSYFESLDYLKSSNNSKLERLRASVKSHLCDLENLGYTPALPVAGLNVELHNYQLQSLQWALDQEGLKGGIHRQLFAPVLNADGEDTGMWYSPFLDETIKIEYELLDVRGGFICDEMGLGK
eukprot:gene38001-51320_t